VKRRSSQLLTQLMQLRKESLKKCGLLEYYWVICGLLGYLTRFVFLLSTSFSWLFLCVLLCQMCLLFFFILPCGTKFREVLVFVIFCDFFRLSFRNCISCVNNCEDLLFTYLLKFLLLFNGLLLQKCVYIYLCLSLRFAFCHS